uniref:AlNc14C133G7027 protein n=1 Tax=Albugo laibachii Nc14 TaxID=890382 RepID=F0WKH7_9STRA|nr:AlNc14C133G7027 [Albugo laibachii Nc14]|eukprot:CCA21781.1 AlNc14C133G7027 [Albugo laibachii Nc14]
MSGDDRRQSPLRSEVEHVIQNIVQTQTRRVVPECSLQGSIVSDATEYQNRLALNEQQQAMKRGMEQ